MLARSWKNVSCPLKEVVFACVFRGDTHASKERRGAVAQKLAPSQGCCPGLGRAGAGLGGLVCPLACALQARDLPASPASGVPFRSRHVPALDLLRHRLVFFRECPELLNILVF